MNDVIPFFSDLHIKAIPAVQRLFDEALEPGYSLPKSYSNLVSGLNKVGVTPPVRKHVAQWLAAVKIGMAGRPELPEAIEMPVSPLAPTPGYFDNLPEAALPALMAAWDVIQAAGEDTDDADEKAFEAFFDAILAIGHMEPSWRGFVAYAKGVRSGDIERPARQIVETVAADPIPEEAPAEEKPEPRRRRVKADVLVADPDTGTVVQPDIIVEQDEATGMIVTAAVELPKNDQHVGDAYGFVRLTPQNFSAAISAEDQASTDAVVSQLHAIRDRMVDETMMRLQAEMRRKAETIVAGQLRALADEMESKVAC